MKALEILMKGIDKAVLLSFFFNPVLLIEQEAISGFKEDNYETRKKHGSLDITKAFGV